nr:hypothetical protein [Tanacetum cinerariifolium]
MDKSHSYLTHNKHQALFDALLNSTCLNDIVSRGQADPKKILKKRDHDGDDKDEDPFAGPNQGKKTKRSRTKESESSKKISTTKETSKGNFLTKGSKSDKYVHAEESVAEPTKKLGVESYQKKLNITKPQKDFLGISAKELYTPSFDPPGVVYEDLNKRTRVMRADELYKFSDGTLKLVHDELHHRILNFRLGYNKEMSRRKWSAMYKRRSELMVELIDKQMRERRIKRNLERLVMGNLIWTTS